MSRTLTLSWQEPRLFQTGARVHSGDGRDDTPADRATWVLALGFVSLFIGPLGIIAWMAGNASLLAIQAGRMDPAAESNAKAGRLLGIIAIAMFCIKLVGLSSYLAFHFWL
jgi:hypothetical protein